MYIDLKAIPHNSITVFITFHTNGTWLHGDSRGSVDRYTNVYGRPQLPPHARRNLCEQARLKRAPVRLDAAQRSAAAAAIYETCQYRGWVLHAENVRTNHVHVVVSATEDPKRIAAVFKAYATRKMRESGCWSSADSPWARGASVRRVWSEAELRRVVRYVAERQGGSLEDVE